MGNSIGIPLTCRAKAIYLSKGHILTAYISKKKTPTEFKFVDIDLNDWIGNNNGEFDVTKTKFSKSSSRPYLEGFILHANLGYRDKNKVHREVSRSIDLSLFIWVVGDELKFHRPSTNIGDTGCSFDLSGGAEYSALCLNRHGELQYSYIDLNKHLGNTNGKFVTGSKDYLNTGTDFYLDETGLILCGKLLNYEKKYVDATFDLSKAFANIKGVLTYKTPDSPFDRDGMVTEFVETVPYMGWLAVAAHLRANNPDHAKRAIARTAYATIVFSATSTGMIVGGPIGLVIGAAAGTLLGMAVEGLVRLTVSDTTVSDDIDTITLKRFVKESLINTVSAGGGTLLSKVASKYALPAGAKVFQEKIVTKVQERLTEEFVDKVSGQAFSTALTATAAAFEEYANKPGCEW